MSQYNMRTGHTPINVDDLLQIVGFRTPAIKRSDRQFGQADRGLDQAGRRMDITESLGQQNLDLRSLVNRDANDRFDRGLTSQRELQDDQQQFAGSQAALDRFTQMGRDFTSGQRQRDIAELGLESSENLRQANAGLLGAQTASQNLQNQLMMQQLGLMQDENGVDQNVELESNLLNTLTQAINQDVDFWERISTGPFSVSAENPDAGTLPDLLSILGTNLFGSPREKAANQRERELQRLNLAAERGSNITPTPDVLRALPEDVLQQLLGGDVQNMDSETLRQLVLELMREQLGR